MGFYSERILPGLCDRAMRNPEFRAYRERVVGAAEGRVLEIGAGSGLNLRYYSDRAREVIALEPELEMTAMATQRAASAGRTVNWLHASAEDIPLDEASVDTVVSTWTLCTIPHAAAALAQMRRVLKPGGRLLFVEHGRSPEPGVALWQRRLTPLWKRIAGGCCMDRPIETLIRDAGFNLERLETGYARGPKVLTWLYEGSAVR
ncbi:MAG TPA: class I SAM-dependent methyltransferase [Caulobacteraceae bacterium]|jgi:ubiquinone/menaquinone biosynthesis C-methylase UbiE|nr:class I SAM-dependent methyltransferase [Caulobacteraceae bacterium]